MALKDTHKSIGAIADELGVNFALEGSVRKVGETLRITAQLIDAREDQNLWANRYEGTLDDVFRFQEQASRAIVDALDIKVRPVESDPQTTLSSENPRGYDQYLRARHELNLGTPLSLQAGLRHMQAALKAFGPNELILRGIAEAHLFIVEYGMDEEGHALRSAEELMAELERRSSSSAATHYLRGKIQRIKGDHIAVFRNSRRAVELDPNNASALINLVSSAALQLGRPEWVNDDVDRMLELDPFNPLALLVAGHHRAVSGQYEAALRSFRNAIELEPDFVHAHVIGTVFVNSWRGEPERAIEDLGPLVESASAEPLIEIARFLYSALRHDPGCSDLTLPDSVINHIWSDPEAPYFVSSAFALAGNADKALTWLERAIDRGWINHPLFAELDPHFASLHQDPRFQRLMHRVEGLWEQAGRELR